MRAVKITILALILVSIFISFSESPVSAQTPAVQPPNTQQFYVLITSSFPGQSQQLTLPLNSTGYMMYPNWNFFLFSAGNLNTSYQIYLNGGKVATGTFTFKAEVPMNVSGNTANVSIILSNPVNSTVYNFYEIPILHTTLKQYYTPAPVELPVYTISQFTEGLLKSALTTIFALIGSIFIIHRTYILKKKLEVEIR